MFFIFLLLVSSSSYPSIDFFSTETFLKNIYFSYLFVARAIAKAKDVLLGFDINTGHSEQDTKTKAKKEKKKWMKNSIVFLQELLAKLLSQQLLCSPTFDERFFFFNFYFLFYFLFFFSLMFRDSSSDRLRDELQSRFRNISQIMDCVECETCKVRKEKERKKSFFF